MTLSNDFRIPATIHFAGLRLAKTTTAVDVAIVEM